MSNDEQKIPDVELGEQEQMNSADESADTADLVEPSIESLTLELAQAHATISELEKQLAELEPRAMAEVQNQRRRAEQEVEKARKFALERFTHERLPVIDSLERAIEAASGDDEAVTVLREGVEMTHKMFIDGVAKFNVEMVNPQGEVFNPEHHQAMSLVDAPDATPNTVVAVMQKGYLLNGRLIRPAMVMVAKG